MLERRKLPTVLERAGIADRGHEGGRREGTNAWNRHQALALGMRRSHGFEFLLVIGQLLLQQGKLVHELPKQLLAQGRELVLFGLKLANHDVTEWRYAFREDKAILVQQPVDVIHEGRPLAPEPLADTMERLRIWSKTSPRFHENSGTAR